MVRPRQYVEAPPVTPLPYGLLSAAIVTDDLTGHAQMGYHYQPDLCGVAHITRAACEAAVEGDPTEKTRYEDGLPIVEGDPFVTYHIFTCAPVGGVDVEERARAALRLGEGRAVEAAVAERLAAADGAVDLTPVAAVHPVDGLAILEGWAAANYAGVPVIHTPRRVGTILGTEGAIMRAGNGARLETVQGALVASGGGYADLAGPPDDLGAGGPVEAAEGEAWLYVTGQVWVRRAPDAEVTPMTLSRTPATNVAHVLAERPHGVSWECITGAVRVTAAYGGAA